MHETFQRALNPGPRYTCLGFKLQSLTVGHLFLLQELESPVLSPDGGAEDGDLLLAVAVCSRGHRAARRYLRSWRASLAMWFRGLGYGKRIYSEAVRFFEYLGTEMQCPPIQSTGEGGRTLAAPMEWRLYEMLRSVYGLSHDSALDTPVCVAQCLWSTRGELLDYFRLATPGASLAATIRRLTAKGQAARN